MFDRMLGATGGSSAASSQAASALTRFGLINTNSVDKRDDENTKEEDGILAIEVAERMLKWHAEAIGRCVELSPPTDVFVCSSS
jgi:exocyst complex component 5